MKIKALFVKIVVVATLVAVAAPLFSSCGKDKDDKNNTNQNQKPPQLGPLEKTVWLADTSISTPQIPGVPLPDITVDFSSKLHFTTASDGYMTINIDLLGRSDTMGYTYIFDNNRGIMTSTLNTDYAVPFTKNGNVINVRVSRDIIPDTSSILDMVFGYLEMQGGLKFNYYKQ